MLEIKEAAELAASHCIMHALVRFMSKRYALHTLPSHTSRHSVVMSGGCEWVQH